jgi:predicted  nucleic acid-binding Zn-ribbon protein
MLGDKKLSTSIEMEQLQNEKVRLEEESHYLDEKLKQLETHWKVLNEKVAIQELKNENAAKQEAINQLQSKISLLETRLEKRPTNENAEDQEAMRETGDASGEEQEKDEDTITVTALNGEEEINENFGTQ